MNSFFSLNRLQSIQRLKFDQKYLNGSLEGEDSVSESALEEYASWIDILHHRESDIENPLLHLDVIDRLHNEIESIEVKFFDLLHLLRTNQFVPSLILDS